MQFDADEFDAQEFEPSNATEDQCWAAIPLLEGTLKARTLNHLGGLAYEREDFRKASMLADQAAVEWQTLGHDDEAAKCLSNAGSCLRSVGDLEQAVPFYMKAAKISSDSGDEEFFALTNVILGSIHNELYEVDKSLEFYLTAMHAAERAESVIQTINALEGVGVGYLNIGSPEIAIDFLQKGFNIASQEGKVKAAANFRTMIAACHQTMNRPDLAIDEIKSARELALLMNDYPLACERGNTMSEIYRALGNFELAIEIAHEVKEVATREKFPKVAAEASANIGHALNCLGQYESAYQLLTSAAEIMKMGGDFATAILAEAGAAHSALGMGNIALAQLRLDTCEKTSQKIDLLKCEREFNLNNPHSMLSLVQFQLEIEIQLAAGKGKPFNFGNKNMEELFALESKAVYQENQSVVNAIVSLKPEFIISAGIPELTSPEGELLTKTLVDLIDSRYFEDDPAKLARFHELQARVRNEKAEATENLSLAITYYLEADQIDKALELSRNLQSQLASRSELSRARAINSRIY